MRIPYIRVMAAVFLCALISVTMTAQSAPEAKCDAKETGRVTDDYYEAVVNRIRPPAWDTELVTITMGRERKIVLRTDGNTFEVLTNTLDTGDRSARSLLEGLVQSCGLPTDPAQAVDLLRAQWKTKKITSSQFAKLHRDFLLALSRYTTSIESRYRSLMKTRLRDFYVDATYYDIEYDNHSAHIRLRAWDVPGDDKRPNPMASWGHELQDFSRDTFGH